MTQPPTLPYATPPRQKSRWWIPLLILLVTGGVLLLLAAFLFTARSVRMQFPATPAVLPPPTTPSRLTILQRQSQPLAGTNNRIIASIGDITGGQVLLTIRDTSGMSLLPNTSMQEGDVHTVLISGIAFEVELIQLKNFLVGDDFAVFEIRKHGTAISEAEKIQRLIDAVANAHGIQFIRNGEAHSPKAAADHLKNKLDAADAPNITARQFIDEIASKSSLSGEEYRVRLPDGREVPAREWFLEQLQQMNSTTRPANQP